MTPFYETDLGKAYCGDSLEVMKQLPDESANLIVTSPPFPLTFQKKTPYASVKLDEYIPWFLNFAEQFHRLLPDDGSLVIDIGGVWNKGAPTKNLYQYHLLIALCERTGFHLAQDFYWYNPGALPAPAEWVNVRRIRVKAAVNLVWWLAKTEWPRADNRNVLRESTAPIWSACWSAAIEIRLVRAGTTLRRSSTRIMVERSPPTFSRWETTIPTENT